MEVAQKVGVRVLERVEVAQRVEVRVGEGVRVFVGQEEGERVEVGVGVRAALPPTVKVRVGEGEKVGVEEVHTDPVREMDIVCVPLRVMEGEPVGEPVALL